MIAGGNPTIKKLRPSPRIPYEVPNHVILSERSESKDLRTTEVRRFLGSPWLRSK